MAFKLHAVYCDCVEFYLFCLHISPLRTGNGAMRDKTCEVSSRVRTRQVLQACSLPHSPHRTLEQSSLQGLVECAWNWEENDKLAKVISQWHFWIICFEWGEIGNKSILLQFSLEGAIPDLASPSTGNKSDCAWFRFLGFEYLRWVPPVVLIQPRVYLN